MWIFGKRAFQAEGIANARMMKVKVFGKIKKSEEACSGSAKGRV